MLCGHWDVCYMMYISLTTLPQTFKIPFSAAESNSLSRLRADELKKHKWNVKTFFTKKYQAKNGKMVKYSDFQFRCEKFRMHCMQDSLKFIETYLDTQMRQIQWVWKLWVIPLHQFNLVKNCLSGGLSATKLQN